MTADRDSPEWTIKMLEIELADERELTAERNSAVLQILNEIASKRGDSASVAELAITAKNILQNGWI